ncbi:MAG TPA: hypothetical protein VGO77_24730, partial [Mycobacterium sp.]|nr:hypothetical protein [Mycobacterium sp.]
LRFSYVTRPILTATELAHNGPAHPLGERLQECFHALTGHAMNL